MRTPETLAGNSTLVIACTDFLEPVLDLGQSVVLRTPCNGLDYSRPGVLAHVLNILKTEQCTRVVIIGHLPCQALENFIDTKSLSSFNRAIHERVHALIRVLHNEPFSTHASKLEGVAIENVRMEVLTLQHLLTKENANMEVEVSGLLVLPTGDKVSIENPVRTL